MPDSNASLTPENTEEPVDSTGSSVFDLVQTGTRSLGGRGGNYNRGYVAGTYGVSRGRRQLCTKSPTFRERG